MEVSFVGEVSFGIGFGEDASDEADGDGVTVTGDGRGVEKEAERSGSGMIGGGESADIGMEIFGEESAGAGDGVGNESRSG